MEREWKFEDASTQSLSLKGYTHLSPLGQVFVQESPFFRQTRSKPLSSGKTRWPLPGVCASFEISSLCHSVSLTLSAHAKSFWFSHPLIEKTRFNQSYSVRHVPTDLSYPLDLLLQTMSGSLSTESQIQDFKKKHGISPHQAYVSLQHTPDALPLSHPSNTHFAPLAKENLSLSHPKEIRALWTPKALYRVIKLRNNKTPMGWIVEIEIQIDVDGAVWITDSEFEFITLFTNEEPQSQGHMYCIQKAPESARNPVSGVVYVLGQY